MPTNKKSSRPKSNKTGSTGKTSKKQTRKPKAKPRVEQDTRAFGEDPIVVTGGARSVGEDPIVVTGG